MPGTIGRSTIPPAWPRGFGRRSTAAPKPPARRLRPAGEVRIPSPHIVGAILLKTEMDGGCGQAMSMLDLDALHATRLEREPFDHCVLPAFVRPEDRKSTRLNSSH